MDHRQFSQAATASLARDYSKRQGKGQPAQVGGDFPEDPGPVEPLPQSHVHTSLFAPVEANLGLRRDDLLRVAETGHSMNFRRRPQQREPSIPVFMRQTVSLSSLGERAARPTTQLVQPPHSLAPEGLRRGTPPISHSVSADRVTDSLDNVRAAMAVAQALRAPTPAAPSGAQIPAPMFQRALPARYPYLPTFAESYVDVSALQREGYSSTQLAQLLTEQARWFMD